VIKLLKYAQFLNESNSSPEEFNDLPWEEDLNNGIKRLLDIKDELENTEVGSGRYRFNIKIYEGFDLQKLASKTGKSEDFIYDEYNQFISDRLEGFIEDLEQEYDWIENIGQDGRSGGWLVIETSKNPDEILNDIEYLTDDYSSIKEQYDFPLSEEEMDDINFYLESNKSLYDFGLAEKPQIVRDLYDTCKETIKLIDGAIEDWENFIGAMHDIDRSIKISKGLVPHEFESYFLSFYGKDDQKV